MALCGVRSKQELTSRAVASGLRRSLRPVAWSVRWPFHDGLMAAQIMGNVRVCKAELYSLSCFVLVPNTSMAVEEDTK